MTESEIYNTIGEAGFDRLVACFYAQVPGDAILGPMYPADDMEGARERLRDFLIQRFGGPTKYSDTRGHPRLRMRHAPFPIDEAAVDRWLMLMKNALTEAQIAPEVRQILWPYFVQTATFMRNR